jgi:hypothetical protein
VAQALAREPAARFRDAGALAAALDRGGGPARRRRRGRRPGPALAVAVTAWASRPARRSSALLARRRRRRPTCSSWARPRSPADRPPRSPRRATGQAALGVRRVIGDRRRRHADEVSAVTFTPDGEAGGLRRPRRRRPLVGRRRRRGRRARGRHRARAVGPRPPPRRPGGRGRARWAYGSSIPVTRSDRRAASGSTPEQAPGVAATAVERLPDGRVATAHTDGALRLWTLEGELASRRQLQLGALWDLALDAPRDRLLVVGNDDGGGLPVSGQAAGSCGST